MSPSSVVHRTRSYVRENFLYARAESELAEEASLLADGIIDSMGVMELITFVETEFEVAVTDEEITEENFGSLGAIARYVTAKRGV